MTELAHLTEAKRKASAAVAVLSVIRDRAQYAWDEAGRAFAEAEAEFHRADKEWADAKRNRNNFT